jgi:predicted HNH restriction endonuclease
MGKPYKKGTCEKCGFKGYVNDHHIVPKHVKRGNNKSTIRLCLNCHQDIHEQLPDELQDESFYALFTQKWLLGLLVLLIILMIYTL